MTTPRLKHFTITARDPENHPMETRLIKARTEAQVKAMLKREALKTVEDFVVQTATQDELIELTKADVKVEEIDAE